jgi:hypothetical protein
MVEAGLRCRTAMEIRDGFIVDVYNYCDRWCEACPLTSRCRLFADVAEMEASLDPTLKPVADAPPLPEDALPPPPRWMQELLHEINDAAQATISDEEWERLKPRISPAHESIEARAHDYFSRAHAWVRTQDEPVLGDPGDPRAVINWFHSLIPAKVHRALVGLADGWDFDGPPDHDGSAKVALIGIDRSHEACLDAIACALATAEDMRPLIDDLEWLRGELERVFPRARAFVRPAFDEPDEVAKLIATER